MGAPRKVCDFQSVQIRYGQGLQVNISIMRTFIKLRSFLLMKNDNTSRINNLEEGTNRLFKVVFQRLDEIEEIMSPKLNQNRKKIGLKEN